ncbi:MAG: cadmium-translocating P-type ATPase [Anaerolineae bacterium]|jgi:Cd2+/Zn2+-exporting ATPase/Cu+-exporting ATPase|nr:cadmium-translocating P-type ATPase [Anaerolineae bacterium]
MKTIEIPIQGMDCAECAHHVHRAIAQLPGVESVSVLLAGQKALIQLDPARVTLPDLQRAVSDAGYRVGAMPDQSAMSRSIFNLFGIVFGAVLMIVVFGEGFGVFEQLTATIPPILGYGLVILAGYPVLIKVIRATLRRQVIAHTLMTIGVLAALLIGEWVTAGVVVFLMRMGDYTERFTAERSRQALRSLITLAPQTARVDHEGQEQVIPIDQLQIDDVVIVRPGEKLPADGQVIAGSATIDQSAITGESLPVEIGVGDSVFAATLAQFGSLRVRVTAIGAESTFGQVIQMVEAAEAHRGEVQRLADRFAGYFLPVVATIAILTWVITQNPLSVTAVLVVACSCSIALATPIAMLASIGASAKFGLLIKGGKYLEILAQAQVILIDKTGTLTEGRPQITDVIPLTDDHTPDTLLTLAAAAERDSEHPLAESIRQAAQTRQLPRLEPSDFTALPGVGVRATVQGHQLEIVKSDETALHAQGKTVMAVCQDGQLIGYLAAMDTLRPEIPAAIAELRELGFSEIRMITGDHPAVAAAIAQHLGIAYDANLLPQDKLALVRAYQGRGQRVVMIGDGVNDAPALAQADVGIALGSDIAIEAAHLVLMRPDWRLVPEAFRVARRTMQVVRLNLGFTMGYNTIGIGLAALGVLPPILAASLQSLPDLGILANSSRLLRQTRHD